MLYKLGWHLGEVFYKDRLAKTNETFDKGDIEVYAYSFEKFWELVLPLTLFQVVGILIGAGFETLFFLLALLSLRFTAGGFHAKTSGVCFLSSSSIYAVFLIFLFFVPHWMIGYVALICVCLSVVPILKIAPYIDKGNPLGKRLTKVCRKRARAILVIQIVVIVVLCSVIFISNFIGFPIADIIARICLSIALGQFTAAVSLVLAKVTNQE